MHSETFLISDSITLILGDAMRIIPGLPCVDAVITDPPYSSGGMVRGDRTASTRAKYQSTGADKLHPCFTGDNRDQRSFAAWCSMWLAELLEITVPAGICCLFSDWRQLPCMTDALQIGGWVWRGIVPWDKVNSRPMPNRFRAQCEYVLWATNGPREFGMQGATYHDGILRESAPNLSTRVHSTQKPIGIMEKLVAVAPAGGLVLDPFMGSATTGIACIRTGRRFIGIEKDPAIFALAKERIETELTRSTP